MAETDPDLRDVQGNILQGYGACYVRHLVVRVIDAHAARAFLAAVVSGRKGVPQVTTAERWEDGIKPDTCLNVGITSAGLRALGLDEASLATFPIEYREGAAARAEKVGDVDTSGPREWHDGLGEPDRAHVMWTIHALHDKEHLDAAAARIESIWHDSGAFTVTSRMDGATFDTYPDQDDGAPSRVHFGYRDSISQPRFEVGNETYGPSDSQPTAPVGAVLLGADYATPFRDVLWQLPTATRDSETFGLGTNGCFNAFRVLEQDVHGFERFLEETADEINRELAWRLTKAGKTAAPTGEAATVWDKERVAAKLMGRWRNGVPLSLSHWTTPGSRPTPHLGPGMPVCLEESQLDDFDFPDEDPQLDDPDGTHCPIGAHIRRANPRGSRIVQRSANYTRPIVRRGMPYGPPYDPTAGDDGVPRGLLGNFLCASLVAQYEAVMYDWINIGLQDPRITRTNDPICGANHPVASRFEIPIDSGDEVVEPIVVTGFPRFTTTVASLYLFCPSISALRFLAALGDTRVPAEQTAATRLRWRLRRGFWNRIATVKYKGQKPTVIPVPTGDGPRVELVPFVTQFPDIPIGNLVVSDRIPAEEKDKAKEIFTRAQHWLVRRVPPMQAGLPPVSADGEIALAKAYTPAHRACFPAPVRPGECDLGTLAASSPYASYLHATGDGGFRWNLGELADYEVHRGLRHLGAVVDFAVDPSTGRLTAVRIDSALGPAEPGDKAWEPATLLATCTITTHASMIRHFNWLHLTAGPVLEASTRNTMRESHPLRRFLWPHVFGTHAGNALVTEILMSRGGEFDAIFSFEHRAKCRLFEATTGDFDLAAINPLLDAQRRGIGELASPSRDNWSALYAVFLAHARRYLALYYQSDDDLTNDQQLGGWIADLDLRLPHGVRGVLGDGTTRDGVAALLATVVYLASVEHEISGSGLWDYQLWPDTSPVRIAESGTAVPIDVYQRLINSNFNLQVHRTMLLDDNMPRMATDARGASAFVAFQQDLLRLQAEFDRSAPASWRIEPRRLKANINA